MEYVGVDDRNIVARIVGDRTYRIVTAIKHTVVDCNIMVVVTEE